MAGFATAIEIRSTPSQIARAISKRAPSIIRPSLRFRINNLRAVSSACLRICDTSSSLSRSLAAPTDASPVTREISDAGSGARRGGACRLHCDDRRAQGRKRRCGPVRQVNIGQCRSSTRFAGSCRTPRSPQLPVQGRYRPGRTTSPAAVAAARNADVFAAVIDNLPAVLAAYYGRPHQGTATADVIFGVTPRAGKPPITIARLTCHACPHTICP